MGRPKGSKNKNVLKTVSRTCACGCLSIFTCKENSSQKYVYGHNNKGKSLLKGYKRSQEFKDKIRNFNKSEKNPRRIAREIRFCQCGCGESFEVKVNHTKRFISGHNDNTFFRKNCGILLLERLGIEVKYQGSYEKRLLEVLDGCKDVLCISRANFRIPYITEDLRTHTYQPDFIVITDSGSYIVETKSTRIYDIHNGYLKLEVGKKYAKANNMGYLLVMEVHKTFSSVTTMFSEVIQKATTTTQ